MQFEDQIRAFSGANVGVAIAQCVQDLGCTVYANGEELAPWASHKVQELVGFRLQDSAAITTQHEISYFILRKDDADHFQLLHGPLTENELSRHMAKASAAAK